jgi:TRAP-type C4-dicarboxylate transport system substrate-binding protein
MTESTEKERRAIVEQLEAAREKLRATGATVLSPTAEWNELRKEVQALAKKLK